MGTISKKMSEDKLTSTELAEFANGLAWEKYAKDKDIRKNLRAIYTKVVEIEGEVPEPKKAKSSKSTSSKKTDTSEDNDGGNDAPVATSDNGAATRVKLVVVGDGAVGKTSLLIVYATGKFPSTYLPTVFENYTAQTEHKGQEILLHLWDTAGQEDYDRLRPLSYPGADVVLLCFSLTNKASYEAVRDKWSPEVKHYVPTIPHVLVGLKKDLRDGEDKDPDSGSKFTPITTEEGKKMKSEIDACLYHEVSAKTEDGLKELFADVVDKVLAHRSSAEGGAGDDDDDTGTVVTAKKKKKNCLLL